MKYSFGLCLFLWMICITTGEVDYCSLCSNHTMCAYPSPEPGPNCGTYLGGGVNEADKAKILDAHNTYREHVAKGFETAGNPSGPQPKAANMRRLEWDEEMAAVAQRWANQCTFGRDHCRDNDEFAVGQSAKLVPLDEDVGVLDWQWVVDEFHRQVSIFNPAWIDPYHYEEGCSHYGQLMWAETYKIGCGFSLYNTTSEALIKQLFVCNYGPTGNVIGTTMYKKGLACSQCPPGTVCPLFNYPMLCVEQVG